MLDQRLPDALTGGRAGQRGPIVWRGAGEEHPWRPRLVGAGAGRPAREGEIDFLVLRPGDGILCLEVKGGQIAYDGRSYLWTSKDRSGATHRIADPFAQAQTQVKDLVAEIGRHDDLELLTDEPQLSIVPFRHVPSGDADLNAHNAALARELQVDGRVYVAPAEVDGRVYLRPCFVNYRTTDDDVRAIYRYLRSVRGS